MYVYSLVLCCVIFVSDGRRLHRRSVDCTDGIYKLMGNTCCLCPKGYRVVTHCTESSQTKCERCDPDTYMDHPNSNLYCQSCQTCSPNAKMEMKVRCSPYSNTVCRCQEDHYCDKGDHCKLCKTCGKCENGVKTKCTETNNTVCEDATPKSSETTAIVVPIVVVLIIIIVVGVVLFMYIYKWRRETDKPEPSQEVKLLQDVDINKYLTEIGEHLSWKVMKRVAQHSGMTAATIDNQESSYPNDARQQTDGLLREWSQTQGLYKAYPALIRSLRAIKERRTADVIEQIVEKGEAKKRDINGTGH